jgi:hypothetical protein
MGLPKTVPSDVCQFSVCTQRTTIRWTGKVGLVKGLKRQVIDTEKWLCVDDTRRVTRAQARGLPINLTPDGWVYIDSADLVVRRLD